MTSPLRTATAERVGGEPRDTVRVLYHRFDLESGAPYADVFQNVVYWTASDFHMGLTDATRVYNVVAQPSIEVEISGTATSFPTVVANLLDDEISPFQNAGQLPREWRLKLNELRRLPDNWDGVGAPLISANALQRTRSILTRVMRLIRTRWTDALRSPFIAPSLDGGVTIEWKSTDGGEIIIDVAAEGQAEYLLVIPTIHGEEEREGVIDGPDDADYLFNTFVMRPTLL